MIFNPENFGLKTDYLYEVITCTYSKSEEDKKIKPNASCMGIRVDEYNLIEIGPYSTTSTYKNLKENKILTLNFVDDIYLYALAALKEPNSSIGLQDLSTNYYNFKKLETREILIPYINDAWGILICEPVKEFLKIKQNELGEIKIPFFKLKVIFCDKLKQSFKLFIRAENLTLEIIILATRLKVAKEMKNASLFDEIYEKIIDLMETVKRLGKHDRVLKTIDHVNDYIKILMD